MRMQNIVLLLLASLMLGSSASAYVVWRPGTSDKLWSNASNWDGSEPEPQPGQVVYIQSSGGNWTVVDPDTGGDIPFPAGEDWAVNIDSAVNFTAANALSQINIGVWGSGPDVPSYVKMTDGSIAVTGRIAVGHDDGGYTGIWEQSGGYTDAGSGGFFLGYGNNARGEAYISGGELHSYGDGLRFHQSSGLLEISGTGAVYAERVQNFEVSQDELISIKDDGKLYLSGAQNPSTGAYWTDWVAGLAASDSIVGFDGTGATVDSYYDQGLDKTVVFSIPEPATLGLLILGGAALIRRKK